MTVTLDGVFEATKRGIGMTAAVIADLMKEPVGPVLEALEELVKQERIRAYEDRNGDARYRCILPDAAWVDLAFSHFVETAVEEQETDFGFVSYYTPEEDQLEIAPARFRVTYGYIAESPPGGASKTGHENFHFDVGIMAKVFDTFPKIWASSQPYGFISFEGHIKGEKAIVSIHYCPIIGQPYIGKLHKGGNIELFDEPEPYESDADVDEMDDLMSDLIDESEQRIDEMLEDEDDERDEGGQG